MKARVSPRYFVVYCLWKLSLDSNLLQTPSNLISLTFFGNSQACHLVLI